jgi:hypothetical protein
MSIVAKKPRLNRCLSARRNAQIRLYAFEIPKESTDFSTGAIIANN